MITLLYSDSDEWMECLRAVNEAKATGNVSVVYLSEDLAYRLVDKAGIDLNGIKGCKIHISGVKAVPDHNLEGDELHIAYE